MSRIFIITITALLWAQPATAQSVVIPAGTRIFGELQQEVSSDIDEFSVGDFVEGTVWRNIVVDGRTIIEAGAPMTLQVSDIKKRRTFGRAGNVEVRAVSVTAVDGTEIFLDGGYDKKGESRVVLSSTLAALVAWPTLFIKGKEAVLAPGTVFDAAIPANTRVAVAAGAPQTIRISNLSDLSVEILYDAMTADSKTLPLRISLCDTQWTGDVRVTAVNDDAIEALGVELGDVVRDGDCARADGAVDLKDLSEHFTNGINRFTVTQGGESAEVMLDVEM
jgi:hypothetical protein